MHARNFMLYLFDRHEYVKREQFNERAGLPLSISKTLCEEIAIYDKGKGWKLKLSADKDFVKR